MADLTKAQLSTRVLEHLGILAAGESASTADDARVQEAIDSAYERLRKLGLVPFATSAVPPWAQVALRDYVAGDIAESFGLRDPKWKAMQSLAERDLRRQTAGFRHPIPIRADYF